MPFCLVTPSFRVRLVYLLIIILYVYRLNEKNTEATKGKTLFKNYICKFYFDCGIFYSYLYNFKKILKIRISICENPE